MTGHPCPYCNAIFAYPRGLAWHCYIAHLSNAIEHTAIADGCSRALQKAGCPFCKEHIGPTDDDDVRGSWVISQDCSLDEIWRYHLNQCNGYAAAMLSGVKL